MRWHSHACRFTSKEPACSLLAGDEHRCVRGPYDSSQISKTHTEGRLGQAQAMKAFSLNVSLQADEAMHTLRAPTDTHGRVDEIPPPSDPGRVLSDSRNRPIV